MKCINCSRNIPEMPEDAARDELLCDMCYLAEETFNQLPENLQYKGIMEEIFNCIADGDNTPEEIIQRLNFMEETR
jgi:hypothetical protein